MSTPAFEVEDAIYRYDGVTALDRLSLSVGEGERIAVLGANGSGKSTLLRLLDALYFPESGMVRAFGERLAPERLADARFSVEFRRRVGFVFQNPDVQLFNPTVWDEIAFGPLQLGWTRDMIRQRISETMDFMEISHLKDRPPHRLSGGEKKRVALASVIVFDPDVLLLDEPTAALDPKSQSKIIDLLVDWAGGVKTVVTATHQLDIVPDIADRCVVLQQGAVVAGGPPMEILSDSRLLERTGLVHAHRHIHPGGTVHSHPHLHQHEHLES